VLEDFACRDEEGVLLVAKAGEMLYHLRKAARLVSGNLAIPLTPILLNSFNVGPGSARTIRSQKRLNKR
jgi:hypothetical protein